VGRGRQVSRGVYRRSSGAPTTTPTAINTRFQNSTGRTSSRVMLAANAVLTRTLARPSPRRPRDRGVDAYLTGSQKRDGRGRRRPGGDESREERRGDEPASAERPLGARRDDEHEEEQRSERQRVPEAERRGELRLHRRLPVAAPHCDEDARDRDCAQRRAHDQGGLGDEDGDDRGVPEGHRGVREQDRATAISSKSACPFARLAISATTAVEFTSPPKKPVTA